jgi:large subunit ribosomal protein L3
LQFSPRKRAKSLMPRARSWPKAEGVLGFAGYKVGMATAMVTPKNPQSPMAGKKVSKAVTVVEVPPVKLKSVRLYKAGQYGDEIVAESGDVKKLDAKADYARFIFETQPKLAGFPRKKPEELEVAYGGSVEDALAFAKEHLGKELKFSEVFGAGELVDISGVTRGRGLQGPVRRFGIKLLPAKTEKARRKPGSLGPWTPKRTPWQTAMAGQTGFHTRTEYNKLILRVGGGDVNPKKGWHNYGLVKSDYIVVQGSVPGPAKRTLRIRKAIRPHGRETYELKNLVIGGDVR